MSTGISLIHKPGKKDNQNRFYSVKRRNLFFSRLWFATHKKHKRKGKTTKKMNDSIGEVDPGKSHTIHIYIYIVDHQIRQQLHIWSCFGFHEKDSQRYILLQEQFVFQQILVLYLLQKIAINTNDVLSYWASCKFIVLAVTFCYFLL